MKSRHYIFFLFLCLSAHADVVDDLVECETHWADCESGLSSCQGDYAACVVDLELLRDNVSFYKAVYDECLIRLNSSMNQVASMESNQNLLNSSIDVLRLQVSEGADEKQQLGSMVKELRAESLSLSSELEARNQEINRLTLREGELELIVRELKDDIGKYEEKFDYGCSDPLSAYDDYFPAWSRLPSKGKECLHKLMIMDEIIPQDIPDICGIPVSENELGISIPRSVERIWRSYVEEGFIVWVPEEESYKPVNFGVGCLGFFEARLARDSQNDYESTFWTFIITCLAWVFVLSGRALYKDIRRRKTGRGG